MSTKSIDYFSANQLLESQCERISDIGEALCKIPTDVNSGAASAQLGFILECVVTSADLTAKTLRVLYAVASDAAADFAALDEDIAIELKKFGSELEG